MYHCVEALARADCEYFPPCPGIPALSAVRSLSTLAGMQEVGHEDGGQKT